MTNGGVVDGFDPVVKVLLERAGSGDEERIRLLHMDAACEAPERRVVVEQGGAKYEVRCAPIEFRNVNSGFLPSEVDGYQSLRWGMSEKDVRKAIRGLRVVDGLLVSTKPVAGFAAVTGFHFTNGKLARVTIAMAKPLDKGKSLVERYAAVRDALVGRYGEPHEWETVLATISHWNNDTTVLRVGVEPIGVKLVYESRTLAKEVEQVSGDDL